MQEGLAARLRDFVEQNKFTTKGTLSLALVITERARKQGLPLNPDELVAGSKGQVAGLGKGAVQSILKRHGIDRVLAQEGGRTSRGSLGRMYRYVEFLNSLNLGPKGIETVEAFWVSEVRRYFSSKPFRLHYDSAKTLRSVIRGVLRQAHQRQDDGSGTQYLGAVMQHMVGAKLELIFGPNEIDHHGFSTADNQTGRSGDFLVGDVAIHVTATPSEALILKCRENIESGLSPLIVTSHARAVTAESLAEDRGLSDRVEVIEIEQFVSGNLLERSRFRLEPRRAVAKEFIETYNRIVEAVETDQSLRIVE